MIFASIRKYGFLVSPTGITTGVLSFVQILTGVYLISVALPCPVTGLTIKREIGWQFASKLIFKELSAASIFMFFCVYRKNYLKKVILTAPQIKSFEKVSRRFPAFLVRVRDFFHILTTRNHTNVYSESKTIVPALLFRPKIVSIVSRLRASFE